MSQIPPEFNQLAHDFAVWATSIDARQRAVEILLRDKFGVTQQEWDSALERARRASGIPVYPESTTDTLAGFLRTLTAKA